MEYDYNFIGPALVGCEDFLPVTLKEEKVPGRREEALARLNDIHSTVAKSYKRRGRPCRVGHHVVRNLPKSFSVQLNNN